MNNFSLTTTSSASWGQCGWEQTLNSKPGGRHILETIIYVAGTIWSSMCSSKTLYNFMLIRTGSEVSKPFLKSTVCVQMHLSLLYVKLTKTKTLLPVSCKTESVLSHATSHSAKYGFQNARLQFNKCKVGLIPKTRQL